MQLHERLNAIVEALLKGDGYRETLIEEGYRLVEAIDDSSWDRGLYAEREKAITAFKKEALR